MCVKEIPHHGGATYVSLLAEMSLILGYSRYLTAYELCPTYHGQLPPYIYSIAADAYLIGCLHGCNRIG